MSFAELHCLSNFSFHRGASHARELVVQAKALGYAALAITDECSMAGAVRALEAAEDEQFPVIHGTEITTVEGSTLVLLAPTLLAYQQLCRLITRARRRAEKGRYLLHDADLLADELSACLALWCPPRLGDAALQAQLAGWQHRFGDRLWMAAGRFLEADDAARLKQLEALSLSHGVPCVAANAVHMHARERQPLQDLLTAIRLGKPVAECGTALFANGERHLRPIETLRRLYPARWLAESLRIAELCRFSLRELRYQYPRELTPAGEPPMRRLRELTLAGMARCWPQGATTAVTEQIEKELALIEEFDYAPFFLTVEDLVREARRRGILCQGRGSAANSAVCYALGITSVNPAESNLLFERFLSRERKEPPDIDVDFEHARREEIIQYLYGKYGRERAALAATVIHYRRDSAIQDVGRALGLEPSQLAALTSGLAWWDDFAQVQQRCRELGFDADAPRFQLFYALVQQLRGFPRHLSQHVGGFVLSDAPLWQLVPVENAAMAERSIIQWDKDDLETLGLLKVDVLALGMLTALRGMFDLLGRWQGRAPMALHEIPQEDAATYAMISRGETVGVFQIESRAQMAMLPRLRPKTFYDLVIEVAIVRPGPIQGQMVHPYLRRRQGKEPVSYPSAALEKVLGRTLGVPLFQEQVMSICVVAAGFTPGEADEVRRSMAAWKRRGGLEKFRDKLMAGMAARGYAQDFAERIYQQLLGFGEYGFPESHAASFALLTYASSWLKCHHPAAFLAALINAQPMGFYAPAQLVADARRNGVKVLPVDVRYSDWDCALVAESPQPACGRPAVRLGLRMVSGLPEHEGRAIAALMRSDSAPADLGRLVQGLQLGPRAVNALAEAGALQGWLGHRHQARWAALAGRAMPPLLAAAQIQEPAVLLPEPSLGTEVTADYNSLGLSLRAHPLALLRARLQGQGAVTAVALRHLRSGAAVTVAGLVTHRQRPGTASGIVFATLEDETGLANLIIRTPEQAHYRRALLDARLMRVQGELQSVEGVVNVVVGRIDDLTPWLGTLATYSRDFH